MTGKLDESIFLAIILIEIDFQFLFKIMKTNGAKQFLPSIHNNKKIEVSLDGSDAVLQLLTWTDGLGWCCQKTMRLEAEMLDDLHRVITAARYKINQQKADKSEFSSSKILEFPAVA